MKKITSILNDLKDSNIPIHIRFELIETYADAVETSDDIMDFISLMDNEHNSIVRHEISAQLLRINNKKPHLLKPVQGTIENFLINVVKDDKSIVSRHEAIEALSSIGGSKSLEYLLSLSKTEINTDILDTINITLPLIRLRLSNIEKPTPDINASSCGA